MIEGLFAGLEPLEPMVEAVRQARRGGVRTGLISNSWVMDHYTDDIRSLFDALVISAEVGLHKPQPEIYLLAAERLGVDPKQCIFVDDLRENCAGAEEVGMTAVLHRDPDETVAWHTTLAEMSPAEPNLQLTLASYYERAGRTDLAEKAKTRAKELTSK